MGEKRVGPIHVLEDHKRKGEQGKIAGNSGKTRGEGMFLLSPKSEAGNTTATRKRVES